MSSPDPQNLDDPSDAEFESDRRELDGTMEKIESWDGSAENRDSEAGLAAGELLRRFYVKHRSRLEAAGIDVTETLLRLTEKRKVMEEALKIEDKATENHLQAMADSAEANTSLIGAAQRHASGGDFTSERRLRL
jgi:phage terminase large subunit-like protein